MIPVTTYLWLFGFIAVWGYFTAFMYTMQEAYEDNDTGFVSYRWADSSENENVTTISDFQGKPTEAEFHFFLVYYVFGLLWLTQFIIAAGSFVISGTLAEWYGSFEFLLHVPSPIGKCVPSGALLTIEFGLANPILFN